MMAGGEENNKTLSERGNINMAYSNDHKFGKPLPSHKYWNVATKSEIICSYYRWYSNEIVRTYVVRVGYCHVSMYWS